MLRGPNVGEFSNVSVTVILNNSKLFNVRYEFGQSASLWTSEQHSYDWLAGWLIYFMSYQHINGDLPQRSPIQVLTVVDVI
jgi:hypothetical protein